MLLLLLLLCVLLWRQVFVGSALSSDDAGVAAIKAWAVDKLPSGPLCYLLLQNVVQGCVLAATGLGLQAVSRLKAGTCIAGHEHFKGLAIQHGWRLCSRLLVCAGDKLALT